MEGEGNGEREEEEGGRKGEGRMEWRYFFRTDAVGQRANRKTGDKLLGTKLTGTEKKKMMVINKTSQQHGEAGGGLTWNGS